MDVSLDVLPTWAFSWTQSHNIVLCFQKTIGPIRNARVNEYISSYAYRFLLICFIHFVAILASPIIIKNAWRNCGKKSFSRITTLEYIVFDLMIFEWVGNMLNERKNCILASVKQINVSHVIPLKRRTRVSFFLQKNPLQCIIYSNIIIISATIRFNYNSLTFCEDKIKYNINMLSNRLL